MGSKYGLEKRKTYRIKRKTKQKSNRLLWKVTKSHKNHRKKIRQKTQWKRKQMTSLMKQKLQKMLRVKSKKNQYKIKKNRFKWIKQSLYLNKRDNKITFKLSKKNLRWNKNLVKLLSNQNSLYNKNQSCKRSKTKNCLHKTKSRHLRK